MGAGILECERVMWSGLYHGMKEKFTEDIYLS